MMKLFKSWKVLAVSALLVAMLAGAVIAKAGEGRCTVEGCTCGVFIPDAQGNRTYCARCGHGYHLHQ